jgi:hypothetical protein
MPAQSSVWINLSYKGDPFAFWEILKTMKADAEMNGAAFKCERVTTFTTED